MSFLQFFIKRSEIVQIGWQLILPVKFRILWSSVNFYSFYSKMNFGLTFIGIFVFAKTDVFQKKCNFCSITCTIITKIVPMYFICLLYVLPKFCLKILSSFRVLAI